MQVQDNPADFQEAVKENPSSPTGFIDTSEDVEKSVSWFQHRFKSCPSSLSLLKEAEKQILSYVKTPITGKFVNIGPVVGKKDQNIWTLSLTENGAEKTPLVLLHGLGSGVALWSLNLDGLAADRHVHAFDMLGFARSSRPSFSCNAQDVEKELVDSVEKWRKEMKLERFVLLGHSMGAYVVTAYAIKYPERVSHLILADPWGYSEKPADAAQRYPLWVKTLVYVTQPLNPLWPIRMFGMAKGPKMIEKYRPDLIQKYSPMSEPGESKIADYIYHCNQQTPSGESAFRSLMNQYKWAKNPMINRISSLEKDVPMTFIYGGRTFLDHCSEDEIKEKRPGSYIDVQIMPGCGHHVNADNWELFNKIVLKGAANGDARDSNKDKARESSASANSIK